MVKYYDEFESINSREIYLPSSTKKEEFIIPSCYYINPLGKLYNGFSKEGHKEANLIYTYELIKDSFYDKRYVSLDNDGKISLQKMLVEELKIYKRIIKTNSVTKQDVKKYLKLSFCDIEDPLIIKLVIGTISSKIMLLNKFIELQNKSSNKIEAIEKIINLSNDDIREILVRYCGFHKIESILNRTITTTALNLNSFINYLENDWSIHIIPRMFLYDQDDELYRTLVVDKFLDKNPQYSDKIKINKLTLHKCHYDD